MENLQSTSLLSMYSIQIHGLFSLFLSLNLYGTFEEEQKKNEGSFSKGKSLVYLTIEMQNINL